MKRTITSEYFGGTEPITEPPKIRCSLEFDDQGVDNIAKLVFNGMRGGDHSKTTLCKNDMRTWTKQIMEKRHPGK